MVYPIPPTPLSLLDPSLAILPKLPSNKIKRRSVCVLHAFQWPPGFPSWCLWEFVIRMPTLIVLCYVFAPSRLGCRPQSNVRQRHNWRSDPNPINDALVIDMPPKSIRVATLIPKVTEINEGSEPNPKRDQNRLG